MWAWAVFGPLASGIFELFQQRRSYYTRHRVSYNDDFVLLSGDFHISTDNSYIENNKSFGVWPKHNS